MLAAIAEFAFDRKDALLEFLLCGGDGPLGVFDLVIDREVVETHAETSIECDCSTFSGLFSGTSNPASLASFIESVPLTSPCRRVWSIAKSTKVTNVPEGLTVL